ncbi:DUF6650 family protein [Citrobacter europaeus]|uniref:DUF6650 family protein n=1 Tax=Citrobacter europaeus TaxID=1914243 RepID=UPI003EDA2109
MHYKDILKHISGISCPLFGIQWNPPTYSSDIAREIVLFLENKRVLFNFPQNEVINICILSANEIRVELVNQQKKTNDTKLNEVIRKMLYCTRDFVNKAEQISLGTNTVVMQSMLERELLGYRRKMGNLIAILSVRYGIDVGDELAVILPLVNFE